MAFFRLIRYPNLLIVCLTQFLFYWFICRVFASNQLSPALDFFHFSLLVLTTVCIAAAGYIINDLMDYEIDLINKPDRMIIGKSITKAKAQVQYYLVVAVGGLIALYLAWHIDNFPLFLLYPSAVFLLWWYSRHLKKQPFSGNIVVALFSAFVAGIVWFAERKGFAALTSDFGLQMRGLFLFYMTFAFCSSLFREVIKDIEDYRGDIDNGCKTLAIVLGIGPVRRFTLGLGALLVLSILYWIFSQWNALSPVLLLLTFLLLLFPSLFANWTFYRSNSKADYHRSSQITKLVMVAGLVYLLLFLILK